MIRRILPVAFAIASIASPSIADDAPRLVAPMYAELPLGAIKPSGWLKAQLEIQAKGLGGHLDEFWPDIKDSAWIGGKAEGWERTPYWLDGAIPLAYLLDDAALKSKVKRFVDYILDHQADDGWLGPVGDNDPGHKPYDVWPLFVMFKALIQYQEATGDPRIIPALLKCSKKIDEVTTKTSLYSWAFYRGADLMVGLQWLHEKTGDAGVLALSNKIAKQSYDWRNHFEHFEKYRDKQTRFGLDNHGVNTGMGLKFGAVRSRHSGDPKDRSAITNMLDQLDRYHGQATGVFSCDEHLGGRSPSQGTELCTVAEMMYSLELAEGISGDASLGDRLERLAYNAFPATFKKDMCAHQYDQQANQVVVKVSEPRVYTDNGPESNLYGLEPNFGCCTANMHQGWPKFVTHLWAKSSIGGLAAMAYAPSVVETTFDHVKVRVATETDYPFSDSLRFVVTSERPSGERFPLSLRIPSWADSFSYTILFRGEGTPERELSTTAGRSASNSRYQTIWCDRSGVTTIVLRLPMSASLDRRFNDSVAIERGPLVYSLKIDAEWKKLRGKEPFADYEVFPTSPWNYTLAIDREHPEKSITFETKPVGADPFSQAGSPIVAWVKGRRLPSWGMDRNAAAPPPKSPVTSAEPVVDLVLIPYGCTDLRVTEFPTLRP